MITVQEFLKACGEDTPIRVLSGDAFLSRKIREKAINRPGLAFAGFYKYFAEKRIQVLGLAETTYLKSLSEKERRSRIEGFFARRIPCIVYTRKLQPSKDVVELANKYRTPILGVPHITSDFINLATLEMERLTAPTKRVHGTFVDISGVGVMITGEAGAGKSEAALGLIEKGHSLVADDLTILQKTGIHSLSGTSSEVTRYHMEIRGLGIIHVPSLFGMSAVRRKKGLDLIVHLYHPQDGVDDERLGLDKKVKTLLEVEVPLLNLPVRAGRDIAGVVEVAAMNLRLKLLGHDAAKELNDKIIQSHADKKIRENEV